MNTDLTPYPSISVVICTYNGEKYIGEQIESILGQTLLPEEIIVGDDGSSDGTLSVIEELREKIEERGIRLSIYNNDHLGPHDNFKKTLQLATCELIAPCDQDDIWLPEKLEMCANEMFANNAMLSFCDDIIRYENGREERMRIPVPTILDQLWGTSLAGHLFLVKKELLKVFKTTPSITFDFGLSIHATCFQSIVRTENAYNIWRRHETVVTTEFSNHNIHHIEKLGKWSKFFCAIFLLARRRHSMVIQNRQNDISKIIDSSNQKTRINIGSSYIANRMAKQTVLSIFQAGFSYQRLRCQYTSAYKQYSIKNKIAARLFWFLYPACWWYDYRNHDAL